MTTRQTVTINGPEDRQRIATWARNVEAGTVVTFRKKSRSSEQSAKMWAMLHEVSEQVEWYGAKLDAEDWKDVFTASLRHARVVPGIDKGTFVPLGMRTSTMTIDEMSNLIELIYAFGADPEHPVLFKEPKEHPDTGDVSSSVPVDADEPPSSAEDGGSPAQEPPSSPILTEELPKLRAYAKDLFVRAANPDTTAATMQAIEGRWASDIEKMSTEAKLAARSISLSMRAIMRGDVEFQTAVEFHAEGLMCKPADLGGAA